MKSKPQKNKAVKAWMILDKQGKPFTVRFHYKPDLKYGFHHLGWWYTGEGFTLSRVLITLIKPYKTKKK